MKLINSETGRIADFTDLNTPPYAILSHCWSSDELLYRDFPLNWASNDREGRRGFQKLRGLLKLARQDGHEYVWIDTCCIDKTSSAELTEAINSMFKWYEESEVCYAYLEDVSDVFESTNDRSFVQSRWFTRGWTLQELIAPRVMQFFDSNWSFIATRDTAASQISKRTGIDVKLLIEHEGRLSNRLSTYSVAQRMSWAAHRETTRAEDRAYSLFGLFNVNMPLLYGEGNSSFYRLQEEIIRQTVDLSILSWTPSRQSSIDYKGQLLASDPNEFGGCGALVYAKGLAGMQTERDITGSNRGMRITALVMIASDATTGQEGLAMALNCRKMDDITTVAALKLTLATGPGTRNLQDALKQRVAHCVVGWTQTYNETKMTYVDTIDLANQATLKDVEIRGTWTLSAAEMIDQGGRDWTMLWIRFTVASQRSGWSILDIYPKQYWHRHNRTFDLAGARKAAMVLEEAVDAIEGESILGLPVHGAIALKKGAIEFIISFSQRSASLRDGIVYAVSRYDLVNFQQVRNQLEDPQHSCKFVDGRVVEVELHVRRIESSIVGQLAVTLTETDPNGLNNRRSLLHRFKGSGSSSRDGNVN